MLQCLSDKAFLTTVQSCFKPNKIRIIKLEPSLPLSLSLYIHSFMFNQKSAPPYLPVETFSLMNEWLMQHHYCLLSQGCLMHFVTKVAPIHYIDGNCHIKQLESCTTCLIVWLIRKHVHLTIPWEH